MRLSLTSPLGANTNLLVPAPRETRQRQPWGLNCQSLCRRQCMLVKYAAFATTPFALASRQTHVEILVYPSSIWGCESQVLNIALHSTCPNYWTLYLILDSKLWPTSIFVFPMRKTEINTEQFLYCCSIRGCAYSEHLTILHISLVLPIVHTECIIFALGKYKLTCPKPHPCRHQHWSWQKKNSLYAVIKWQIVATKKRAGKCTASGSGQMAHNFCAWTQFLSL